MGFIVALQVFRWILEQKSFESVTRKFPFAGPRLCHNVLEFVFWRAGETLTPRRQILVDSEFAKGKTIPAVRNGFRWPAAPVQAGLSKHFTELCFTPQLELVGMIDELHVSRRSNELPHRVGFGPKGHQLDHAVGRENLALGGVDARQYMVPLGQFHDRIFADFADHRPTKAAFFH